MSGVILALRRHMATVVWLGLSAITCLSWELSTTPSPHSEAMAVNIALVVLAFVKVRFIVFHFMKAAEGPFLLKLSCDAWIVITAALVIGAFVWV